MAKINVRDRNKNSSVKKPNWEYRFEAASIGGKRKQISKAGFKTKREALEAGSAALAEYNSTGLHFEPTDISVSDYLDYWFEVYVKVNLKYNTQRAYLDLFEHHYKPYFGMYKLKALNPSVLQEYINSLKMEGFAKSSIKSILFTLSGALDYAIEPLHYIKDNPCRFVKIPAIEKPKYERIILSVVEWETIINRFPPSSRFYIPLMIGYYCGLRIAETFALTWDDINLERRELTVSKQIIKRKVNNENKQAWYFSSPKTFSSKRTIKFGETLALALKNEQEKQQINEQKYGNFYTIHITTTEKDEKNNNLVRLVPLEKCVETRHPILKMVCVDENGSYTSPDSFKYCARIIHHELGLKFDYHSLRHTHATMLIENGAEVKDVQIRLGHQNIVTTLQTYVHGTNKMANESVEIFERAVSDKRKMSTE